MSTDPEKAYETLVSEIEASTSAKASKMFGMPCLKTERGKAFAGYFKGDVTFKLPPQTVQSWMKQPGAVLFDPGMGRPMKEWVQLSADHQIHWKELALEAFDYVSNLTR